MVPKCYRLGDAGCAPMESRARNNQSWRFCKVYISHYANRLFFDFDLRSVADRVYWERPGSGRVARRLAACTLIIPGSLSCKRLQTGKLVKSRGFFMIL